MNRHPFFLGDSSNLTRALDYQRGTYLGADNGVLAMEQAPKVSSPVEFLAAAANDAGVAAPQAFHADFTASSVPSMIGGAGSYSSQHGNTKVMEVIDRKSTDMDEGDGVHSADGSDANGASGATDPLEKRRDSACALIWSVEGELQELDERATDEACSVAGAAQALARIACRLYDLADKLGGEPTRNRFFHVFLVRYKCQDGFTRCREINQSIDRSIGESGMRVSKSRWIDDLTS